MFSRFLNVVDERVKTCCMPKHYRSLVFDVLKSGIKSLCKKEKDQELE